MTPRRLRLPVLLALALGILASVTFADAPAGSSTEPAAVPQAQAAPAAPETAPVAPGATTAEPAAGAKAKAAPPLLWRIEAEGATKPSWLFGTIHLPDQRVTTLAGAVEEALAGADIVATEIHLTAETRQRVTAGAMLPADQSLTELLPAPLVERTTAFLKSRGLPFAAFTRMKIWALSTQMSLLDYLPQMMMNPPLDMQLHNRAEKAGKRTEGIETVDEQLQVFDSLTIEQQIELHEKALDQVEKAAEEGTSPARELVETYLAGDIDALMAKIEESMEPGDPLTERLMNSLLNERNHRMAERIEARVAGEPDASWFFAIGAGHMGGDEGLLVLLRARGLTVTRAAAAP